nr:MAG TPA: hypothetical protein [Caudoviricetes sp.]
MGELLVVVLIALVVGCFYQMIENVMVQNETIEYEVESLRAEKLDWIAFNEIIPDTTYLDWGGESYMFADDVEQGKIYIDYGKKVIWQASVHENGLKVFKAIGKMY